MSRNVKQAPPKLANKAARKPDRRVRRSREVLGDALVKLMHEQPFEDITVKHILDRAEVSRSTFYTHFSDKNDLFLSDAEEFFEMMSQYLSHHDSASRRVAPVREMFTHLAEWRPFYDAMVAAGKIQDVMEIGEECFARGIAQRLKEIAGRKTGTTTRARSTKNSVQPSATPEARMLAGALTSLMSWWIHAGQVFSPAQMDDRYHNLVWSGIVT